MVARSVQELTSEYVDKEWRQKFLDFFDLMEILGDCFIADNYTIPDSLNNALPLSQAGKDLMGKLTRKEKVNPKEARLMCALSIGHEELFVDIDALDVELLVASIHEQLIENAIRFPLVHGRELYDAFADLHEEEKEYLNNADTIRLLERLPIGVFQYGRFITGPFGLKRSLASRSIQSSRRVPAFHCERSTCREVHPVVLQTGDAPINKERDKIVRLLEAEGEPSEWVEFADELRGLKSAFFADSRSGVLLPLLGDALSDEELRALVVELLDNTGGEIREHVREYLQVGDAKLAAFELERAQLLQLLLVARENDLARTVDRLTRDGRIEVPEGDVRRAVIGRDRATGSFRLRAELGHHGVRFVSTDPGYPLLKLRRLLDELYVVAGETGESERHELEWQLREVNIEDLNERLENFYRSSSPEYAIERLVLARRSNLVLACHETGIEDFSDYDDRQIVSALLWKLGFRAREEEDLHESFWEHHQRLWALTQSSEMGQSARFLETASPYFNELEGILIDSLAFTTWALINDHSKAIHPFTYDNDSDRRDGLVLVDTAKQRYQGSDTKPVRYESEKVDLHDLIMGFSLLAMQLEEFRKERSSHLRNRDEFPDFHGKTRLKIFKFVSLIPFLDLSEPSQARIIEGLRDVSRTLRENEVSLVRNDYAHYRRNMPDIERVEKAMDAIRRAVSKLENLGFCRLMYKPSTVLTDEWGHHKQLFRGPRSYEHTFTRPTPYDWMGLPELSKSQYLMRSATFEDPNEVLRFTRRYKSPFSEHWEGFPNRRKRGNKPISDDESLGHKTESKVTAV